MMKSYDSIFQSYRVLGLGVGASQNEIRSAYRDRIKEWHPDVARGDQEVAEEEAKKINEAFRRLKTLSSDDLKTVAKSYRTEQARRKRAPSRQRNVSRSRARNSAKSRRKRSSVEVTTEEILRWTPTAASFSERRGRDVIGAVEMTREEERSEVRWRFVVPTCHGCGGWGGALGAGFLVCEACGGLGLRNLPISTTIPTALCSHCHGRGCFYEESCPTCGGSSESTSYRAHCCIPPGTGRAVYGVLNGLGHPGVGGAGAGNLYLVITVV